MNSEPMSIALIEQGQTEGAGERKDAAENRRRILEVAEQLFADEGVDSVHMASVARAAGVGKGTLYRRFENKGALCLALLHDQFVQHQETVLGRLRRMEMEGESHLSRLQYFLRALVDFAEGHVALLREVQREGLAGAEGEDAPLLQWQSMTVNGLLRAAAEAGELDAGLDLDIVSDLLLAPVTASFLSYLLSGRGHSAERIGDGLAALVGRLGQG